MKKIGVIHATASAVAPLMSAFHEQAPEVQVLNFVNENFFLHCKEHGGVDKEILRDFAALCFTAADAGVDAILVGCSMFCRYTGAVQPFLAIPILAVDDPMMEEAVRIGTRIGVLATNPMTIDTSVAQLRVHAAQQGKEIRVLTQGVPEAAAALRQGCPAQHDQRIAEAGKTLAAQGCEVLLLCQLTMAGAAESMQSIGVPVITSPSAAVQALKEAIGV